MAVFTPGFTSVHRSENQCITPFRCEGDIFESSSVTSDTNDRCKNQTHAFHRHSIKETIITQ